MKKSPPVIGAAVGLALSVLCWIQLAWWMNDYQARTGYDAGNAGVLGVCAMVVLPAVGWAIGMLFPRN